MHHNRTDHPGLRCTNMGKTYQSPLASPVSNWASLHRGWSYVGLTQTPKSTWLLLVKFSFQHTPWHLFLGNRQWPLFPFGQHILVGNVPTHIPRVARPPIDPCLDQLSSNMSQQYDKNTPTILNTSTVSIASCKFAQQVEDGSFAWDHMRYCLAP